VWVHVGVGTCIYVWVCVRVCGCMYVVAWVVEWMGG